MAVIQPRPTHILYKCAKFGDDRTSLNLYPYFGILFLSYGRDIDLKFIQDTYRVVINSLKKKLTFIGQMSRSQGRYFCFLKVVIL